MPRDADTIRVDFANWTISRGPATAFLRPSEPRVAAIAIAACGHPVSDADMIEALYGDREDGGPLKPQVTIRQFILHARRKLKPLGITFDVVWGRGIEARICPMPPRPTAPSPAAFMVPA